MIFIVEGKAFYVLRVLNLWRAICFPNYLAFSDLKIAATLMDLKEYLIESNRKRRRYPRMERT